MGVPGMIHGLLLLGLLLLSTACKTTSQAVSVRPAVFPQTTRLFTEMYSKYNKGYAIQDEAKVPDDCGSFYVGADSGIPLKGTVVAFHGFTACPQQFWEFSQRLKKEGYATLALLLPGHGRAPPPTASNDDRMVQGRPYAEYYAEFLPKTQKDGWKTYLSFVEDVNTFAASLPGEKLLLGFSAGAALATYASIQDPLLYKRALLLAPYFGMPRPDLFQKIAASDNDSEALYRIQRRFATMDQGVFDAVAPLDVSWGPDCYSQTRGRGKGGRRGICDFRFENLAAINAFGMHVLALLKDREGLTQIPDIQMLGVDWDEGSDTTMARQAMGYLRARFDAEKVQGCFYPRMFPHSFFSRKDLSNVPDTSWVPSFYSQSMDFLLKGSRFRVAEGSSLEFLYDGLKDRNLPDHYARCAVF
jgi:pimeloyl-ACP methyl ester carboxylesterase